MKFSIIPGHDGTPHQRSYLQEGEHKRNFEAGMLTDDPDHLRELMDWIDHLYLGEFCQKCQRRSACPDPIA